MKLKRRDFLKLVGATGAGLALSQMGFNVGQIEAASNEFKIHGAKEYTSICNFCSCSCGMICHVKDGKLINLREIRTTSSTRGALQQGAACYEVVNSPERVKTRCIVLRAAIIGKRLAGTRLSTRSPGR